MTRFTNPLIIIIIIIIMYTGCVHVPCTQPMYTAVYTARVRAVYCKRPVHTHQCWIVNYNYNYNYK